MKAGGQSNDSPHQSLDLGAMVDGLKDQVFGEGIRQHSGSREGSPFFTGKRLAGMIGVVHKPAVYMQAVRVNQNGQGSRHQSPSMMIRGDLPHNNKAKANLGLPV